jgi:hypothetical protein
LAGADFLAVGAVVTEEAFFGAGVLVAAAFVAAVFVAGVFVALVAGALVAGAFGGALDAGADFVAGRALVPDTAVPDAALRAAAGFAAAGALIAGAARLAGDGFFAGAAFAGAGFFTVDLAAVAVAAFFAGDDFAGDDFTGAIFAAVADFCAAGAALRRGGDFFAGPGLLAGAGCGPVLAWPPTRRSARPIRPTAAIRTTPLLLGSGFRPHRLACARKGGKYMGTEAAPPVPTPPGAPGGRLGCWCDDEDE